MANLRILVPEETANLVKNPSFRFGIDGWNTIGNQLIISDSLIRADGSIGITDGKGADVPGGAGYAWNGATWRIYGGKAIDIPTMGVELVNDGGLENWSSPTDLTSWGENISGLSTINRENVIIHGGSYSARADIDASGSAVSFYQSKVNPIWAWINIDVWAKSSVDGKSAGAQIATELGAWTLSTVWKKYSSVIQAKTADVTIGIGTFAASSSIYFDDISFKIITLLDLFSAVQSYEKDVSVEVMVIIPPTSYAQGGVVLNLDDISNPQNFVVAYRDGVNNHLDKCVGGTWTSLINTATGYDPSKKISVRKNGTSYRLYNGESLIGEQTISDAGIINNTLHGLFSTHEGNAFNNFAVWKAT